MHNIKILSDLILIAAPTMRTRAYVQNLINYRVFPATIVMLPGNEPAEYPETELDLSFTDFSKTLKFFPNKKLNDCITDLKVKIHMAPHSDLNTSEFIEFWKNIDGKYAVFSGRGGNILDDEILNSGKKFLHAHGGYVPDYKGSTSFYYSMLKENTIGASAIWMKREVDTGDILMRYKCPTPENMDYDLIIDPVLRSFLICEVVKYYADNGYWQDATPQDSKAGCTYFVIHPLLKNRATYRANQKSQDL